MIYKHKDGKYTASSNRCYIPGIYDDERTAKYAFRFSNEQLEVLQDEKNKTDGLITFKDLQELTNKNNIMRKEDKPIDDEIRTAINTR